MTVGSAAANNWKKAVVKMGLSIFRSGFNSSKCKTMAKMTVARVKLLRNKRDAVIKQMRRDIAMLLESGQDTTARIRVEHVIREQNIMAANELIELFCELVVARLTIIAKQRECPADLKEGIASLIFAAPRCSDIPELLSIRDVFQKKYGKDFVSAATDLRPDSGVNRMLIEKLSVKTPSGEIKLKVLKEIAKEYQVQWDTTESEMELLKPPEERIGGPNNFVSATSLPLKPIPKQSPEPSNAPNRGQSNIMNFQDLASAAGIAAEKALAAAEAAAHLASYQATTEATPVKFNPPSQNSTAKSMPNSGYEYYSGYEPDDQHPVKFNPAPHNSTAKSMPNHLPNSGYEYYSGYEPDDQRRINHEQHPVKFNPAPHNSTAKSMPNNLPNSGYEYYSGYESDDQPGVKHEQHINDGRKMFRRQSYNCPRAHADIKFDESDYDEEMEMEEPPRSTDARNMNRRHSYNVPPQQSDIRYDESDDEHIEEVGQPMNGTNRPPDRPAPQAPVRRVHPKLPDYDAIAARFEALKHHKVQPK